MSKRKRINISVDPQTYDELRRLQSAYGFKNCCELIVSFVNILLDRVKAADKRKYDLPDDDGKYIDDMFNELGDAEHTPANTAPPAHYYSKKNG